jgi:glutamate/tyrosine decarboxylase-like PLP-dependent enzyme
MSDPLALKAELRDAVAFAAREADAYLAGLGEDRVLDPGAEPAIDRWSDPMPEQGDGALAALSELAARGGATATRSSGPRFFHFVVGGTTPAALGADWLASTYDQTAFAWASSPFAVRLESVATDWLRQLFELPGEFTGILTSGATMANFVGLAAARGWWAEQQGFDADDAGLAAGDRPRILSSGYIHPSAVQALGMLGLGRENVQRLSRDGTGRLDLDALEAELAADSSSPAIVVANAGEVNTGDFDPIARMAELAERHGAWLHVDGAFGLFARVSPSSRALTEGVERADSVITDGHKWLNVPYDCGIAFVREPARAARAFVVGAEYLPSPDDPHPNPGWVTPENSRRARSLAIWATLRAYGREGYRAMVERHLALAQRLAAAIDEHQSFERLAEVPLNIVCFRARPAGLNEADLNELNAELGAALLADGRVFAGTTTYDGKVCFRPAFVNWLTTEEDVDLLPAVLSELLESRI